MSTPGNRPSGRPIIERPSTAIYFLLVVFAIGLGVGALLAKLRPPPMLAKPVPPPPATTQADGPPLAVGDRVRIVTSDTQTAGSQTDRVLTIDDKGEIPIPLLGALAARGFTPAQLEYAINRGYVGRNLGDRVVVKVTRVPPQ